MSEQRIEGRAHILRVVLILLAIICLARFAMVLLPVDVLTRLAAAFGLLPRGQQTPADAPLFWYSLRISAMLYLTVGLVIFVAARDPVRHRDIVKIGIFSLGVSAALSAGFGPLSAMPPLWYGGDALFSLLFFALLAVFYPRHMEERPGAKA